MEIRENVLIAPKENTFTPFVEQARKAYGPNNAVVALLVCHYRFLTMPLSVTDKILTPLLLSVAKALKHHDQNEKESVPFNESPQNSLPRLKKSMVQALIKNHDLLAPARHLYADWGLFFQKELVDLSIWDDFHQTFF